MAGGVVFGVVKVELVLVEKVRESRSSGAEVFKRLLERFVISVVIVTDKLMRVTVGASWGEGEEGEGEEGEGEGGRGREREEGEIERGGEGGRVTRLKLHPIREF